MSYKNDICEQASKIISGERQGQYGSPEDSFAVIAAFWNTYIESRLNLSCANAIELSSNDVAIMMALMKIARICNGVFKEDSYVDAIGYLAIAAELSKGEEECSACSIDIPGGDPDSCDENGDKNREDGQDEEEVVEDKSCYKCFYHSNGAYDGCLAGYSTEDESVGCKKFKSKACCLTCVNNGGEMIQDENGNLRVLCKLDKEYHYNFTTCKSWEANV